MCVSPEPPAAERQAPLSPAEAYAAIALAAVACDGTLDRPEARALRQQLEDRTPYRSLSAEEMGDLFDRLLALLRRLGWRELLLRAVPALTPPQQESALLMAAQLVRANGVVEPGEEEMLRDLSSLLSVSSDRCRLLLEVVDLLHHDTLAG